LRYFEGLHHLPGHTGYYSRGVWECAQLLKQDADRMLAEDTEDDAAIKNNVADLLAVMYFLDPVQDQRAQERYDWQQWMVRPMLTDMGEC
jgi:hypothetical protein